ncbi:MAG TPA: hypothetical protein GX708_04675 [Gallicola sp.]|nr:hypothetical protein [Gallicola sp.]
MEERLPCDKHEEQIKTLFKQDEVLEEKVKEADNLKEVMYNLDKNMALQTQLLENVVAHNDRQDARMDEQQKTIVKINENLTELTEGQRILNKRVGKLEDQVEKAKHKGKVDIVDTFAKYIPYLILVGTGYLILNITKFIK